MFENDNTPVWLGGLVAAAAIALVASYSQIHGVDQADVSDFATGRTGARTERALDPPRPGSAGPDLIGAGLARIEPAGSGTATPR